MDATTEAPAATETKPADAKPADAAAEVTYTYRTPEGGILAPEGGVTEELTAIAKANGWSAETAQQVFELGDKMMQQQQAAFVETVKGWQSELRADKDIGGDKLNESLATAKRALEAYAEPAFVDFMRESGFLDNPGLVRMLVKVGKSVSEGRVVTPSNGGGTAAGRVSTADVLYGGRAS